MFLQSFWPELASPGPAGSSLGLHIFLKKLAKNRVLETWARKKHVKTQGFWIVDSPKPCILQHFLVAKWNFPGFLLVHLAPRRASWTPPFSWARKWYFSYEDCINQEPFSEGWPNWDSGHVWRLSKWSKPRKIRDSRRVSMLRSAQNLANYMIHALFQCLETPKTLRP